MNVSPRYFFLLIPVLIVSGFSCNSGSGKMLSPLSSDSAAHDLALVKIPAYTAVMSFDKAMMEAQLRNDFWVETPGEQMQKMDQKKFVASDFPKLKSNLLLLSEKWSADNQTKLKTILSLEDQLCAVYKDNMEALAQVSDYNDPAKRLPAVSNAFDDDGTCLTAYRQLRNELDSLEENLHTDVLSGLCSVH
jgi:hypothetical protein